MCTTRIPAHTELRPDISMQHAMKKYASSKEHPLHLRIFAGVFFFSLVDVISAAQ
jgi:hypothetical protein